MKDDIKTHYFTEDQARRIIENEIFLNRKTAFSIALDTGARAGEIIRISAEHFKDGSMMLWDSKKKSWKPVPLSDNIMNDVKLYLKTTKITARLFPVSTVTLNNWLHAALDRENIEPDMNTRIRWHSWRGTFVRMNNDKPMKWIMQITGDNSQTILKYYSKLTEEDLKRIKVGNK